MKYFKKKWTESTGEEWTNNWGESMFYFETDEQLNVERQLQQFENGKFLKYDTKYLEDKFGGLSEVSLDLEGFGDHEISKEEFDQIWKELDYDQFPEIVKTKEVLRGQPRLEEHTFSVGEIVGAINKKDLKSVLLDFDLSHQQVRQAVLYCQWKKCSTGDSFGFCHNCTLSGKQENKKLEKQEDNWKIASELLQRYF